MLKGKTVVTVAQTGGVWQYGKPLLEWLLFQDSDAIFANFSTKVESFLLFLKP